MTYLRDRYEQDLRSGLIHPDEAQAEMVAHLEILVQEILVWQQQPFWSKIIFKRSRRCPKGWYCWGSVGIGKTYLMDLCYESLLTPRKYRRHFHAFMREVHSKLCNMQGRRDPLQKIAENFVKDYDILCFDEFMVHDIADAMLLGELLSALLSRGLVLFATSNTAPENLYHNGLQRSRFLPAIDLIQKHCQVMSLRVDQDYRLKNLKLSGVYFTPLDGATERIMEKCFLDMSSGRGIFNTEVVVLNRSIPVRGVSSEVAWFDFNVLCALGRSQNDYLWIAENFHTVLLGQVVQFKETDTDILTFFTYLVDVLYDAKIKLIVQASVEIEDLYPRGKQIKSFQRTLSRLYEMQTEKYLHTSVHDL